jgi:uncharacterized membrane protein
MTKFCTQCGAQVDENARFCKKCGTKLLPTQPTESGAPTLNYQTPNYQAPNYQAPNYQAPNYQAPNYQQPSDFGSGFGQSPGQVPYQPPYQPPMANADLKPNVAGMLCYPLSLITGILFLVLAPYNRNRFVRFHAWQSIFFFIALVVLSIVLRILLPWPLEWVFLLGLRLLALAGTGWAMYKAYHNEQFKLPLIGDLADNQSSKNTT